MDALVVKDAKIRLLMEIEESGLIPTKICGKFLTSALSQCFIHDVLQNAATEIFDATFIQVLDSRTLKSGTRKIEQGKALEQSIQSILPLRSISKYRLYYFNGSVGFQSDLTSSDFERVVLEACE